jgi:nicotinamide-nucleotide amidase
MCVDLAPLAADVLQAARRCKLTLVTAESCTAGLLSQLLSDAEGAADHFHGGFVTYTKQHKTRALQVPAELLRQKGAVCPEVAEAMVEGALRASDATVSVAITGVAGPEPDEDGNPVGRVCIAVARRGFPTESQEHAYGDRGRQAVRSAAMADALRAVLAAITRNDKL